ncbi:A/G-specific adenine glycosylase [Pseudoneurospora amorphoporcata]|uniref:A/G-specific adenine glycosylase n=1 Tax=Pseudoneurospora amorphoporcata TaxID=241081 RepID=A0AAN6NXD9_9PEZI|nr:A/G-specific adenine glycosylase [Pseudoneurospora amorphoporcata]
MEVIFEDDDDVDEEDADDDLQDEEEIVVVKFGPYHHSTNVTKFGRNLLTMLNELETVSEEDKPGTHSPQDSDLDGEHKSLQTRRRRKTKTGRANATAVTTTVTEMRPKITRELSIRQVITQIFLPDSPHAHGNVHTCPLPPDQPHRHSYHCPLLLSFPGSTGTLSGQDFIAAARKHRDALLIWFDNYSAARQMPWRKPWIDPSPLLCPTSSLVGSQAKVPPPIPDSVLIFPNLAASILRAKAEAEEEKQAQALQTLRSSIYQRFYQVLLAEVLRQVFHETDHDKTIELVTTYYNRWMQALPTMHDLAKSGAKEVEEFLLKKDMRLTRLHMAARQVCSGNSANNKNTAGLPTTVQELENLPGIGPHIAGVVAAVVFGRAEPMVETNVIRVLARQLGIRADVNNKKVRDVIWEAARRLVDQAAWDGVEAEEELEGEANATRSGNETRRRNRGPPRPSDRPGRWGQALMELGATVCLPAPQKPACDLCPIQATCRAYAEGLEIAREKGLAPVGKETTSKEKDSGKREVLLDMEDAACTLCPPPPPPKMKKGNQDGVEWPGEEKTPLPSTKENMPTTTESVQATPSTTQTNRQEENSTISANFYEQDNLKWLRSQMELELGKPKPGILGGLAAREFIATYCRQYPLRHWYYGKRKSQKQDNDTALRSM